MRRRKEEENSIYIETKVPVNRANSNAESTSTGDNNVIQSILKYSKDKYRKVLRISDEYESKSKEKAIIKRAL